MHFVLNAAFSLSFLFIFKMAAAQGGVASIDRCNNGDVRLVSGSDASSGRVEICFNNEWGSICANTNQPWTEDNAAVVCQQLGYSSQGAIVPDIGYFGSGSGTIHLSDIECDGDEQQLTDCVTSFIGEYTCDHDTDVAVVCQAENFSCEDGEVRLRGGVEDNEGRIEICSNNQYGTVCDDNWDSNDANVVCRQLGFSGQGAIALSEAAHGPGYGPVYYNGLNCDGDEGNVSQCNLSEGLSICRHNEDAGVICKRLDSTTSCNDGDTRLVNGRLPSEGRVEVCYNGVWGTICHDLWNDNDAAVVCTQLGYSADGAKAVKYADFGEGEGVIFLDSVQCMGTEESLNECAKEPVGTHNCRHNKDAGVICKAPDSTCVDGEVRLVNGTSDNTGRVEVCYANHFGTVCDNGWTNEDANVVCGQLGYAKQGAVALKGSYYGNGVGLILLDDVECSGDESDLFKCGHNGIGNSVCYHHQDASVLCKEKDTISSECSNGDVRLLQTTTTGADNEGLVERCINGVWSRVCGTGWDDKDARVVCNQLGYSNTQKSISLTRVVNDDSLTLSFNVSCTGSEQRLDHCGNNDVPQHYSCELAAGVICPALKSDCQDGDVRLVGGVSANQGRVETCYNGVWGGVCGSLTDGSWSHEEATVVCHQLGYNPLETRPVPVVGGSFGTGTGPMYLSDIHCYGNENSIKECIGADIKDHSCPAHSRNVGVVCAVYPCLNGDVRLVGGSHGNEGRLELCDNGVWKAVCLDDIITTNHVQDLCSSITGESSSNLHGSYGQAGLFSGVNEVVAGALKGSVKQCSSSSDILQCIKRTFSDDSTNTCGGHNSIGIVCSSASACESGDVRLVGGAMPNEGTVEVCLGNQWGTVCDDNWNSNGATVVCNQMYGELGFDSAIAIPGSYYGNSQSDVLINGMKCDGLEQNLFECLLHGIAVTDSNCPNRHAGVKCIAQQTPSSTPSLLPEHRPDSDNNNVITTTTGSAEIPIPTNQQNINDADSNTPSKSKNDYSHIIIPVAAMMTVTVLIICITIFAVIVYKWRRLSVVVDDHHDNKMTTTTMMDKTVDGVTNPLSTPQQLPPV